jgi:sec-independent protein translocase protein TatA
MGDVAQGIKAFKKGMSDDDTAKAEPPKDPKTIDHQAAEKSAQPERKYEGTAS